MPHKYIYSTGCLNKNAILSLRVFHLRKYATIIKTPGGNLDIGLEIICAKDGRYIFINKKVMAISVRHDFYGRIYELHWEIFICAFRHKATQL
jgi:hypothetical protein